MTNQRMIELLEIERECVLRNASGDCNRYCAECDLLQDDTELHEMYTNVIALLKAQEPRNAIVVSNGIGMSGGWWFQCPSCKMEIEPRDRYCKSCGQAVKWE